jgi:glucose-1-phosphate thymidylyltransferase
MRRLTFDANIDPLARPREERRAQLVNKGMILKGVIMPTSSTAAGDRPVDAALQRIANRPIVCHVLEEMRQAGVVEVALVVPAQESDELQAGVKVDGPEGLDISYIPYKHKSVSEQVLCEAGEFVGEASCVVHAANGLLAQPLAELIAPLHDGGGADGGVPDLVAFVHRPDGDTSTALATRRLMRFVENPPNGGTFALAGVCLFGPGALSRFGTTGSWHGGALDLAAIAEQLVGEGGQLRIEHVRGWWRYTGGPTELLAMNHFLLDTLSSEPPASEAGNRIEGCVAVHPTACVQSSVIVGPVIVGPGALVLEAYIGPYTSIGADVRIEGAEVERSIILPGASITHIGGRLVGSVVGRRARVFRDFSLPRAMRLNVGDGGEVALC